MKYFNVIILFVTFSCFSYSQNSLHPSIGVNYSGLTGLNLEFSNEVILYKNLFAVGRISYNFQESYGFRVGAGFNLLSNDRFKVRLGAEYNYDIHNNSKSDFKIRSKNIEFPIGVNYSVKNNLGIYLGIAPAININNQTGDGVIRVIRTGVTYKF